DQQTMTLDDEAQLTYATERGWIIVTHNERHFRALHGAAVRGSIPPHPGIIILPASVSLSRLVIRATMQLAWLGTQSGTRQQLFKWGQLQELLESGVRLPGFDERDVLEALGRS